VILLDTHAVYWLNQSPEKLSGIATRAIRRAATSTGLGLSSISLWELAWLLQNGRLRLKTATARAFLDALLQTPGLVLLEITTEIALRAAQLPAGFPNDPADRLIAGTAWVHDMPIVTRDRGMQASPLLRTIW
jgi:PIN domain nuclease of toxin-antitoxin system